METNWIRQRREKLKINQEELAARLQVAGFDVTRGSVSHWENGRHQPPLDDPAFIQAIGKALKMTVTEILIASGYDVRLTYGDAARRAADIVEQLPPDEQELAVGILEKFLER